MDQATDQLSIRMSQNEQRLNTIRGLELRTLLWDHLLQQDFKHPHLASNYYGLVRQEPSYFVIPTGENVLAKAVVDAINTRIPRTQERLIGGKLLVGDALFIKAMTKFVADKHDEMVELETRMMALVVSLDREFPGRADFRREILGH